MSSEDNPIATKKTPNQNKKPIFWISEMPNRYIFEEQFDSQSTNSESYLQILEHIEHIHNPVVFVGIWLFVCH